jgi:UrcA family protein
MFKSTVSVLVAAVLLSPAAFAEGKKEVTLSHDYDAALLASDEGASVLLAELTKAARRTCTSRIPAYGGVYTDLACADSLVMAAVKEIHTAQTAAGADIAPSFERIALMQLASAD